MRRFTRIKQLLLTVVALVCVGNAWAEEKTGTYVLAASDAVSDNKVTTVEGITMTFGTMTWTTAKTDVTVNSQTFTTYATGSVNPSPNEGKIPTAGPYVVFEPSFAGTITAVVQNAGTGKKGFIVEDTDNNLINGTVTINGTETAWNSGTNFNSSDSYSGGVKFNVKAGSKYYFYLSGSKMRFMGFIYTYTIPEGLYAVTATGLPDAGGSIKIDKETKADGTTETVTVTATANAHYTFKEWQDADGTTLSTENPYVFDITADANIVAVYEEDAKYSVSYSKGEDESIEGQVPDAVTGYTGATATIPANHGVYKEGYTLTGWTNGTTTYTKGQIVTIGETDIILTPVFTQNTVSLQTRPSEVTIKWDFQRKNGAPTVAYQNVEGLIWVAQAVVEGQTIDVKCDISTKPGKMANGSWTDWCQLNNGTTFTIPSCEGAVVEIEGYNALGVPAKDNQTSFLTIDGKSDYTSGKIVNSTITSTSETIDVIIGEEGSYYRYIQVVLPANILLVEDGKNLTAEGTYASATYTRTVNTAYNYGTICLPFAPDAETCALYTFYALDSYSANTLVFAEVDAPQANTAYLYAAADKQATTHTFTGGETTVSATTVEPAGDYKFIGTFKEESITLSEATGTYYAYKPTEENGYKDVLVEAAGTTMTVKPYRAYFHYTGAAQPATTMRIVVRGQGGEGTTAIEEVIAPDQIEGAAPAIYDLMGRPVAQPVKGQIYIVNGKTMVY